MPIQQDLWNVDEAYLTTLYESGDYSRALQTIDSWNLPSLLKEHPDASGHGSLTLLVANVYRDAARYEAADEFYLQALAGLKHTLGRDHPGYARGLVELGTLYQFQGRYPEASGLFEKARDIHEATTAPDPVAHSRCLQALARLHDTLGNRREAKACLERARVALEQVGAPPVELAGLLLQEAWVLCRLDSVLAVVRRARQALAIYREHKGEHYPGTLQAAYQLGRLLVSLCDLDPGETGILRRAASPPRGSRLGTKKGRRSPSTRCGAVGGPGRARSQPGKTTPRNSAVHKSGRAAPDRPRRGSP